jgi:chaperonin GroEL
MVADLPEDKSSAPMGGGDMGGMGGMGGMGMM